MNPDDARKIAQARCTERLTRQYGSELYSLDEWLTCVDIESRDLEEGYKR